MRSFDTKRWRNKLTAYLAERQTLAAQYAHERRQQLVPVQIAPGQKIAGTANSSVPSLRISERVLFPEEC
jgi:hypothetical protein